MNQHQRVRAEHDMLVNDIARAADSSVTWN